MQNFARYQMVKNTVSHVCVADSLHKFISTCSPLQKIMNKERGGKSFSGVSRSLNDCLVELLIRGHQIIFTTMIPEECIECTVMAVCCPDNPLTHKMWFFKYCEQERQRFSQLLTKKWKLCAWRQPPWLSDDYTLLPLFISCICTSLYVTSTSPTQHLYNISASPTHYLYFSCTSSAQHLFITHTASTQQLYNTCTVPVSHLRIACTSTVKYLYFHLYSTCISLVQRMFVKCVNWSGM